MSSTTMSGSLIKLIDATLEEAEKRNALLRFREDHGLGIKLIKREYLLKTLEDLSIDPSSIILSEQLLEIIRSFWACITDPLMRTASIMGHHLDFLVNEVKLTNTIGIRAICFIQEKYDPPEVLVDLYFNEKTKEGVEVVVNKLGELVFLDPDINKLWPINIRRVVHASVLAYYFALVCPGICEDFPAMDEEKNDKEKREQKKKRKGVVNFRRAHLRTLPEGCIASVRQLALAISSGKYSEDDIERIIREGKHQTFVKEFLREEGDFPEIDPRKLFNKISPIKFLNAYLDLTGG